MGYRKGATGGLETGLEYTNRVSGMMRVYFEILKTPVEKPLDKRFQLPRYWIWFARVLGSRGLLGAMMAPELIYGTSYFYSPLVCLHILMCSGSGIGRVRSRS